MTAAPCSGPCNPSIFDWIGYGVLLIGAAVVLSVAYLLARRLRAHRISHPAFTPIVVIGVAIVLAAIVVPRYPRPTFVPVGTVAGTGGSGEIDPLYLAGSYAVSWTLEPPADTPCRLEAGLYRDDGGFVMQLVTATATLSGETSGIDSLPGARYIIKATSECKWRVMLDPRPKPQ